MNDKPEGPEPIMAELAEPKTQGQRDQSNDKQGAARLITGLVIGLLILGAGGFTARYFLNNQKEADRRTQPTEIPLVQGLRLHPTNFTIILPSQGRVQAAKLTSIIPEVAGRIVSIEPEFKEGGFFKPNQKLLTLNNFDYLNAVAKAEATINQLKAKLELERIGRAAFTNAVDVAKANLEQARLALQLDKIEAASYDNARDVAQANLEQAKVALNLEKLERSGYTNAVTLAKANLAQAQASEKLKVAERDAAIANLKRLGKLEGASPLAKKEPQVAEAKANTLAKEVALNKAVEDLQKRPAQMEADLQAKIKVAQSRLVEANENLELPPARAADFLEKIKVAKVKLKEAEENLKRPAQLEADLLAQIDIANSEREQAEENVKRTVVIAPNYTGRITEKRVDIGQVVTVSTVLATAITTEEAEVRLPISNQRLAHLDLSEQIVDKSETQAHKTQKPPTSPNDENKPDVTLTAVIGTDTNSWKGKIDRAESRYDSASQQLFLIAEVKDPYANQTFLRAGLFVRAKITGEELLNVFRLPRQAVRRGNEVALATMDGNQTILTRKKIDVLWRDEKWIITPSQNYLDKNYLDKKLYHDPLKKGDILITTPIEYATHGEVLLVHVKGEPAPKRKDKPKK